VLEIFIGMNCLHFAFSSDTTFSPNFDCSMESSPPYCIVLGEYHDMFKVFSSGPAGSSFQWLTELQIMRHDELAKLVSESRLGSDERPWPLLRDFCTNTAGSPLSRPTHPVQNPPPEPSILPTFANVTNPLMLQAQVQPTRIYSVDLKAKTAIISYPGSREKQTISWTDLLALNPKLLASFLVQSSP
jgi:hypothetical protein